MNAKTTFKTLRMISSFALLGAVLAGTFFGWGNESTADLARTYGAVGGAAFATTFKVLHLL